MATDSDSGNTNAARALAPDSHRKASDQSIYEAIYEAVLTQRLPPGSRLPEVALSELFGVQPEEGLALERLIKSHLDILFYGISEARP